MDKNILATSFSMKKGLLDDNYTLYDDETVLHEYDKSIYPGGINFSEKLSPMGLNATIKQNLYDSASSENKSLVKSILGL